MKKIGFIVCFFVLISCLFGCASGKVTLFSNAAYPSKKEGATIDVYITNKPLQEYIEFAQITCGDTNDNRNMQQILKKAREIGADGVILTGKVGSSVVVVVSGVAVSEEYGISAIAIKYK